MSTHASARRGLIGTLVAGLVASPLALGFTSPASADVSAKISTLPYNQDWSDASLITVDNNWSGVPGVQGYRGDDLVTATGVDARTVLNDGASTPTSVIANANATNTTGGVIEVQGSSIAIQGSGTADAPHVVFHLDLAGKSGTTFGFNAKDLDASTDDAVQQVALQYRVGTTGAYTNLADGYIADATTGGTATQVTTRSVSLPAATDNQGDVYVRVLTTNAAGNDELVGIDDIAVTSGSVTPGAVTAADPGAKSFTVNQDITPFKLTATGGTAPYSWTATGLPAGLSIATDGTVTGKPTATGTSTVKATATDSASPAASDDVEFTIEVKAAQAVTPIAEIQGTPATQGANAQSPLNGQTVTTEGVVTGYFTGSTATNGGIYIQTGGTGGANDATPDASDGLFVFGGNARPSGVDVGDSVRVTGPVSDFNTLTQITPAAGGVVELGTALAPVTALSLAYPDTAAGREAHESELIAPAGAFTVSNVFNITGGANAFAEIGLASGTKPLQQPTDIADASDDAGIAAVTADNAKRAVALDDGSAVNYMTSPNNAKPLPWITGNTNPPRVGAPVTFTSPVVLDYRNSTWKFQPTTPVTGNGATTATFGTDRAANAKPRNVGGDLQISTFNVLNYFPTTGEAHVAAGGSCTYFTDREGNRIANNSCTPNGPRGAATDASLKRQQDKIVNAINTIDADIVSLEELENSVKMIGQTDRDNAIRTLVAALNAASTSGKWAFAPSPADLPTPAQEDVIRTGFIYQPATVELVGASVILKDEVNFDNAREPLAQAFRPVGGSASSTFGVIVNHFKSKGSACSGTSDDPLQGNCNGDRVGQAEALRDFATSFKSARSIDDLFLVGDFNSYSEEDPMQVLYAAGYENIESDDTDDASYSFNGLAGSLDHVLGNAAAVESVTGSDIWEINANESLAYQYSRYNYHGEIYHSVSPWSSSDHNPEVIGVKTTAAATATVTADDKTVVPGRDTTIPVTVTGSGATPTGTVTVTNGSTTLGTATLVNGAANVAVKTADLAKGTYTLTVTYSGDSTYPSATDTLVLTVEEPATRTIQILGTNDFHGRLLNNQAGAPGSTGGNPAGPNTSTDTQAGAAVLSGAVKQLRGENPDTVFAAAGDLIGASTFESFIQKDEPTIDALNAAGLEVSAAGNHEFDAGYEDLVGRVQDRAKWEYIAANVNEPNGRNDLADTWGKTFGDVKVGFVGAVTEDLPSLVSPAGIQGVTVSDIVDSTNAAAAKLRESGADLVVLLVHEGAPTTTCSSMTDPATTWGNIVVNTSKDVDAIISGHTHLAYNCSFPVAGKNVERPVVSAGQYGTNLNQLKFVVDTQTGTVQSKSQALLPLKNSTTPFAPLYPADPAVTSIVNDAITAAATLGAREVGKIENPFSRAKFGDGTRENRGGESTLGNLVAEIQRWATRNPESGSAQIALMNPGGLRADLVGSGATGSRTVTYREAANVQPFANTLVNMQLTGAQLEDVLEQQWQLTSAGIVPTRPFLKLGQSKGFEYTYTTSVIPTPSTTDGNATYTQGEITSMKLNGVELSPTGTYSVTVNSFLASGGDNFRAFNSGTNKKDTGKADLQAQVDYFEQVVGSTPLPVDYSQRAVGVTFGESGNDAKAGETLGLNLTSLSMTGNAGGVADLKDSAVDVYLGDRLLGSYPVSTVIPNPGTGTGQADAASADEAGTASATVAIPRNAAPGSYDLRVVGRTTGTEIGVPVVVEAGDPVATTVTGQAEPTPYGEDAVVDVTVTPAADTGAAPTGTVEVKDGDTVVASGTLVDGKVSLTVPAEALELGDNVFTLAYSGDANHLASTGSVTVTVVALETTVTATADDVAFGQDAVVHVVIDAVDSDLVPTGTVRLYDGETQVGTVELVDGEGDITLPASALDLGDNTFTVRYLGDEGFEPSEGTVTVTVTRIAATVAGTDTTVTYGQAAQVPVRVGPTSKATPTGTVTVKRGDTVLATATLGAGGTGTATIPALALPAGSYGLTLEYSGDERFAPATGTVTLTVEKAASATDASARETTVQVKKNRTRFTVAVTAEGYRPTGTVQVVINGSQTFTGTLVDGVASIVVGPWTSVGTFDARVSYLGDANTRPSSDTVAITVEKQTPSITVTAPSSVRKGSRATVKVQLSATGAVVTGQVRFSYNGSSVVQTLSNGATSRTLPALQRGTTVTVTYLGSGSFTSVTDSVTIAVR